MKTCNCCQKRLAKKCFGKNAVAPDGLHYTCRTCINKRTNEWRKRNPAYGREYYVALKSETLAAYGNKCACCGETDHAVIDLDHMDNDGGKVRREKSQGGGRGNGLYGWLKKNGWPKNFQLLCRNCNWAKHVNGKRLPERRMSVENKCRVRSLAEVAAEAV